MSPDARTAWAKALRAWQSDLGPDQVVTAGAELALANCATFAHPSTIVAVLKPRDRPQVMRALAIASEFGTPVHPVSRGRNWGFGSRLPPRSRAALLRLDGLNRILDFHPELGTVTVEPGVTFGALFEFLAGHPFFPPQIGAGPHTSVLGNALERGLWQGPYGQTNERICACEVALPNGRIVRAGLTGVPNANPNCVSALAPGPLLTGLFTQSNLGVVLNATLRLQPAPRYQQILRAKFSGHEVLAACIDALRPLLQRGDPRFELALLNGARAQMDGVGPAPRSTAASAAGMHDEWFLYARLMADDFHELAARRRPLAAAIDALDIVASDTGRPERLDRPAQSPDTLRMAYWCKGATLPEDHDPDRDRCGVMWAAPYLPLLGSAVAQALSLIGAIMTEHGFAPAARLHLGDACTVKAMIPILFDRDVPGADDRATACLAAVRDDLLGAGLIPYRLSIADMGHVPVDPGGADLLRALKAWADPKGILSPGHYIGGS